ncbi:uncharacterized protein DSM5745_00887 [Aspergillus mulundensis]|uniref:Uncharacterized protein n=1 Tax=Aspergillus mulundensis TaxID=1810919 RepID=A0A3D8T4U0_9EURO|nr:hypothetical protein DSM5745_00887 [Aspergillus mulundensis]RDW93565.1 hypothetical protein DSM5745_00887 [Aspergillus mulundensis]
MVANKKRLYVALYPSGIPNNEERKYHWGFLVGPKMEGGGDVPGKRYHVKNNPVKGWEYQEVNLPDIRTTTTLLARILIAKIEDEERLVAIIRSIPVVQNDPDWRCRTWLAHALAAMTKDGKAVGTSELDWHKIEALPDDMLQIKRPLVVTKARQILRDPDQLGTCLRISKSCLDCSYEDISAVRRLVAWTSWAWL